MNPTISNSDRSLAVLAHLSGLAGYIIPFGGAVVPVCMMLFIKDRPQVVQIAKQALFLNIAVFIAAIAAIFCVFTIVLIPVAWVVGLLLTPIAVLLPAIGAIKAANGELFRYPIVGSML
jgi:uncharacterized Tic20 family protein